MNFKNNMATPWGPIQTYHHIADGVTMIHTARHGGLYLSAQRVEELPDEYEPFTKSKHWAEEDEDAAIVLQYLNLLSLVDEEMTIEVTEIDIFIGNISRKDYYGTPYHGGPIVEAFKRQTDSPYKDFICANGIIAPRPGGFKLAHLSEEAKALMGEVDAKKEIKPTSVTILPYTIKLPKRFECFLENGKGYSQRVTGSQAHKILNGDQEALADWIDFRKRFPNFEKILRITYKGTTLYEKGTEIQNPFAA